MSGAERFVERGFFDLAILCDQLDVPVEAVRSTARPREAVAVAN